MPQIEYDDGCKDDPNPGALILFWVAVMLILAVSFYAGTRLWRWMHDRTTVTSNTPKAGRYAPLPWPRPRSIA
jgi:hypothetical protein